MITIADIVLITILILSILMLATMFMSMWLFVPYVPTPHKVVRRMVELAELRDGETVYDLGCGDARLLIEAKKKVPGILAIGYELPIGVWILAKIKVWLSGENADIRFGNFLKADLSDADVIFLYLIPEVMPKLIKKISKEVRSGARLISHGFELPGYEPKHMERVPLPSWHFLKPPKKNGPRVFVYECSNNGTQKALHNTPPPTTH